ncbi:kinase-like domain-containing protein, partial [Cunninghamella echinulata]
MANDLLLRLFNSEYFNTWIAISYLFKYSDNIGIQRYLCDALKRFPLVEIEFFLPQLIHLLITCPSINAVLEDTLIDLGKQSPHFAVMSIWYLQAYMTDWSQQPSSPMYQACQRTLHKCQSVLLIDPDIELFQQKNSQDNEDEIDLSTVDSKNNSGAAMIGMGAILSSVLPVISNHIGGLATLQGRIYNSSNNETTADTTTTPTATTMIMDHHHHNNNSNNVESNILKYTQLQRTLSQPILAQQYQRSDSLSPSSIYDDRPQTPPAISTKPFSFSVSLEDLHDGKAFSLSNYFTKHKKWPQSKPLQRIHHQRLTDEFNDELDLHTKIMGTSSVPLNHPPTPAPLSVSSSTTSYLTQKQQKSSVTPSVLSSPTQDLAFGQEVPILDSNATSPRLSFEEHHHNPHLVTKENDIQQQWIKSGYFRSEMQFLIALSDIAERLVAVPKHARVSALHAELSLLNHNLPAEICLPLWCSGSCSPFHHRVIRVSPSDAVVLNSAERAPYLLMIEVLDDAMCLEPEKMKINSNESDVQLLTCDQPLEGYTHHEHQVDKEMELKDENNNNNDDDDDAMDLGIIHKKTKPTLLKNGLGIMNNGSDIIDDGTAPAPATTSLSADSDDASLSDFSRRMRTAAVMLAQLQQQDVNDPSQVMVHAIRQRIIDQMISLEEQRLGSTPTLTSNNNEKSSSSTLMENTFIQQQTSDNNLLKDDQGLQSEQQLAMINNDDPSAIVFSEDWEVKKERIRKNSPYGHLPNWQLISVIVKQGADLRQEQFAIQLIREMQKIWQDAGVDAWVKYYRVLVTSDNSGLIETIRNTMSVHSIKKNAYTKQGKMNKSGYTLRDFFEERWGPTNSSSYKAAQDAFMKSLVGYSIACYILQIKDRHNGNLLIDDQGHLIHIDYGFVLSNSPGSVGFEMAPFKLSQEYVDILGGMHSDLFNQYRKLMKLAFKAIRKYGDNILLLVEMMSQDSTLPCFQQGPTIVLHRLRERFQFHMTEPQLEAFVDKLIMSSC